MKKTIYILFALLLGLASSCVEELTPNELLPKASETGLVAVTMQLTIPQVELLAGTKANTFSHDPQIEDIRVAVFGTSGYPQAYTLAEPCDADGNLTSDAKYAHTNGDPYYFRVLLPVYDGEAHVHIIANGDESIKFHDEDEDSIMKNMKTSGNVGAFWTRVILPDGILTQLDQNGIMQTDSEGNYLPNAATASKFEDLVLIRNFAEVSLSIDNTVTNLSEVSWTLVNKPTYGSVAPIQDNFIDDFEAYTYNETTGRMVNGSTVYNGFVFEDDPMDFTVPEPNSAVSALNFMYERTHPGSQKATCILLKGKYTAEGHATDNYYSYYRIDLMDEAVGGYFPIYRNYHYQVKIHKIGNRGASTPTEAMNRDSGGNVSMSTEAQKLTDISDGESRLYVEYVEKNFTSGGKKGLWVYYAPDAKHPDVIDNTKITVSILEQGSALKEGTSITLAPNSSDTGTYFYEFELNEQSETADLVSKLQVKADNGVEGDDHSTLYREITLRVMKKMDMALSLVPKQVAGQGSSTVLKIGLPDGLPESMFPLELYIEDINHTIYSTGSDGNGNDITVPVKSDKSIVDGTTNSFYFIRTVNYSEYSSNHTISTEFKTNKDASATTIYVANEYFKTQSVNLLNNGMYVNPLKTTVPFNTISVTVEVEFAEPDGKSWTVAAVNGSGITSITNEQGTVITGGTGNGKFVLNFPVNSSTTATVTREARVTYNGTSQTVTITQNPLEFSITPSTQTVIGAATTTTVTIHASEGQAWTASISGPNGVTGYSLSATSGEGSATLTVTLPANETNNQRQFTVTAAATGTSVTVNSTIVQRRSPIGYADFAYNTFGNSWNGTASGTSSDGYVTVDLANCRKRNAWSYIRTASDNGGYGTITFTPVSGMKISSIVITYSDNGHTDQNATVSTGSKSYNGNVLTWTVNSANAVTYTSSSNGTTDAGSRRITNIRVNYEPVQ
ncbi:MAG: BACON domain-containing protein [Bacteroidales bacterium]|nr:BACON domain-containing protein [Bacteroidales bacterium]